VLIFTASGFPASVRRIVRRYGIPGFSGSLTLKESKSAKPAGPAPLW